jgi:hypothetical protein
LVYPKQYVGKNNPVPSDSEPIYLDPHGKAEFYVREGTTTQLLNSRQTVAYIKNHWHR